MASALCALPLALLHVPWGWPMGFRLFLGLNLLVYGVLLCRWSKTELLALLFPALFTCIAVVWPASHQAFLFIILAMFSWIRSGLCYQQAGFMAIIAEAITLAGGVGFLLFWWPHSIFTLPLSIWLFFLVQSLYFYLVPGDAGIADQETIDSFEMASREMERLLDGRKLS